jgi:hypothetical protein
MSRTTLFGVWVFIACFTASALQAEPPAGQPVEAVAAREASQSDAEQTQPDEGQARALRALELRTAVRQAIKKLPKRELPSAQAVHELLGLYQQLKADKEVLSASERQKLLVTLRTRLLRIQQRLAKELAKQGEQQGVAASYAAPASPAEELSAEGAQRRGRRGDKAPSRGKAASSNMSTPDEGNQQQGAPGGASALDNGQQLVELIQEVVAPDIWDVNGGPAVIRYYAPLKVLVVTAPADVHGDVGAVLDGLR